MEKKKVEEMIKEKSEKEKLAFVGDGINDGKYKRPVYRQNS